MRASIHNSLRLAPRSFAAAQCEAMAERVYRALCVESARLSSAIAAAERALEAK